MPDYGQRTGRDTLEIVLRRLDATERELRRLRGGLVTLDRGDTATQPAPVEGQQLIQYDTDQPWYYANGEWRDYCCPVTSGSTSLADSILALTGLDAFWKLNETSGTVAADSSGNGYDLAPYSSSPANSPPVWGQAAGPPGETSAKFASTRGLTRIHHTGYTTNFSALGWFYRDPGGHFDPLIGQGFCAAANSWSVVIESSSVGGGFANKLAIYVAATDALRSDAAITDSTWYMWALTRGATTWKLYLDGALQALTSTASPGTVPTTTWIGNDNLSAFGNKYLDDGLESYVALVARELTAAEILDLYTAAGLGGAYPAGYVLTADGSGATSWAKATIEVEY